MVLYRAESLGVFVQLRRRVAVSVGVVVIPSRRLLS
jgi:hypothetical protein